MHRNTGLALAAAVVAMLAAPLQSQMNGSVVQLTMNGGSTEDMAPTMSADGTVIAWYRTSASTGFDLYTATAPSYTPQLLAASVATLPVWPELSADGTTIAFTDGTDILVVPTAGGPPKNVTNFPSGSSVELFTDLSISDDGRFVCFVQRVGGIPDAAVVDTTTNAIVNVSNNATADIVTTAISGDASTVVFTAKRGGANEAIWASNFSTIIKVRDIAPALPDMLALDHTGTRCAYEIVGGGDTEIWSVRIDGTANTNVSQNPGGADRRVTYAGNGDRIAWKSARTNQNTQADVYIAYPDGTNRRNVSIVGDMNPSILNTEYAIDGDGTRAAFSTRTDLMSGNPEGDSDLYLWTDALTRAGRATPGATVSLLLNEPTAVGLPYVVRTAFARTPGIPLPGAATVPLAPDALFFLSGQLPTVFQGYQGTLSAAGRATAAIAIPNAAALIGLDLYTAFIVVGTPIRVSNSLKTPIR